MQIAALQLVDRGLITLETEIGRYLPGLAHPLILKGFTDQDEPILEEATTKITLTHLLNHTTGLGGIGDWPGKSQSTAPLGAPSHLCH